MCGRYGRRGDKQYIAKHYKVRRVEYGDMPEEHPYAFAPNYNIPPGTFQPEGRRGPDLVTIGPRIVLIYAAMGINPKSGFNSSSRFMSGHTSMTNDSTYRV
jgi:hypothetical protein